MGRIKGVGSIKILIADNYAIMRKGLIQLLRDEFPDASVTEVQHTSEVYEKVKGKIWDIIILDISTRHSNGLEVLKGLKAQGITAPILMLSMYSEHQYALRALKAGAAGFLKKDSTTEEFVIAIHKILKGRKYISAELAEKLAANFGENRDKFPHEFLSDRELLVLQHMANGQTISGIANEISLSVNTISTYRTRILAKLGLRNNSELIRYALDNELV